MAPSRQLQWGFDESIKLLTAINRGKRPEAFV
jgi:hypothetical protein